MSSGRLNIVLRSEKFDCYHNACLYGHWCAGHVQEWLEGAGPRMRRGDPCYGLAGLAAHFAGLDRSIGINGVDIPPEAFGWTPEQWREFFPGSAAAYEVNIDTGQVRHLTQHSFHADRPQDFTIGLLDW